MFSVSIGICAFNEEKNIRKLLDALLNQNTINISISEIIVVSSECTDQTNSIVNEFNNKNSKIRLITQEKREGKVSAINIFIKNATSDILILESADTLPLKDTIEKLILPFYDENVGMTGGHPIPTNDENTFMGFTAKFLWDLHHRLALKNPKLGEIIAFRNIIPNLPKDIAMDEAFIESEIQKKGLMKVYVPDAIVYNKGAETIEDFLKVRRRNYAGHLYLKKKYGYETSSMNTLRIISLIFQYSSFNLKLICWMIASMLLEYYARLLGMYDFYIVKKNPIIWKMANSTKEIQ